MAEKTPIKEQIKKLTDQIEAGIKALFQSGDLGTIPVFGRESI